MEITNSWGRVSRGSCWHTTSPQTLREEAEQVRHRRANAQPVVRRGVDGKLVRIPRQRED